MTDDLSKKKKDGREINVSQEWELRDWSHELKITEDELKSIIDKVGPMAVDVKDYLNKHQ